MSITNIKFVKYALNVIFSLQKDIRDWKDLSQLGESLCPEYKGLSPRVYEQLRKLKKGTTNLIKRGKIFEQILTNNIYSWQMDTVYMFKYH